MVNRNFVLKIMEVLCLLERLRKVEDVEILEDGDDEEVLLQHGLASFALVMDEASLNLPESLLFRYSDGAEVDVGSVQVADDVNGLLPRDHPARGEFDASTQLLL